MQKQQYTFSYQYSRGHFETTEIQSYKHSGPDCRGYSAAYSRHCSHHNRLFNVIIQEIY